MSDGVVAAGTPGPDHHRTGQPAALSVGSGGLALNQRVDVTAPLHAGHRLSPEPVIRPVGSPGAWGWSAVGRLIAALKPADADPHSAQTQPPGVPRTHPHRPRGRRGPTARILLADDNPVNQRIMAAMLQNLGFDVDVAADGAEAVRAATRTTYQAILMDCQMPVLDGYQATGEIRRLQAGSPRTPIIAVSGSALAVDQQRGLAAGMDDHLAKPVGLTALAAVLARWAPEGSAPDPVVVAEAGGSSGSGRTGGAEPAHAGGIADSPRPVLDVRVVARMKRLGEAAGEDLMAQLATLFLADAGARVIALQQALAGDDAAAVARTAHTLCGASDNVGATELARLCAALASAAAADELVGGGARLEAVEAELGRVRTALGSLIPSA